MWQTLKQSFKAFWKKEWTTIWAWLQASAAALVGLFTYLGSVLNDSNVQSALTSLHIDPKVALILAVCAAVTLIAKAH